MTYLEKKSSNILSLGKIEYVLLFHCLYFPFQVLDDSVRL